MNTNSIIDPSGIPGVPKIALTEIACLAKRPDLISLCLTSRAFWNIAISQLYRNLSFKSPAQASKCFQTIISKPQIADCVKSVALTFESTSAPDSDFYQLAVRALCCTTLLQGLEVRRAAIPIFQYVENIPPFKHLTRCVLPMPWKDQAPRFLQSHPDISALECRKDGLPVVEFGEMNPPYKFNLPKLKKLVAESVSTFHYLEGPCPLLQYACINWDDLAATDTILSFLSSSPALHHLDNIVSVQNTPSLSAIGEHVSGVINLTFRLDTNGVRMTEEILEEFHESLKEGIESFERIVTLSVIPVAANDWREYNLDFDEVDDDFDLVMYLGELCPTLCIIATYRGIIWERDIPSGYWLPLVYSKKYEWYCYTDKYDEAELVFVNSWVPSSRGEPVLRAYVWDRLPPP